MFSFALHKSCMDSFPSSEFSNNFFRSFLSLMFYKEEPNKFFESLKILRFPHLKHNLYHCGVSLSFLAMI